LIWQFLILFFLLHIANGLLVNIAQVEIDLQGSYFYFIANIVHVIHRESFYLLSFETSSSLELLNVHDAPSV